MIERETTKHGPALDDDLKRHVASLTGSSPVETRADEERMQEGPDSERLGAGTRPDLPHPGEMSEQELDDRAEIAASLASRHFPIGRDEVVSAGAAHGLDDRLLQALQDLPEESRFDTVQGVWRALGHPTEHR